MKKLNKARFFRINEDLLPVLVNLMNAELSTENNAVITGVTKTILLRLMNEEKLMSNIGLFADMKINRSAIGRTILATDEEIAPLIAAKKRYKMSITKIINGLLTLKDAELKGVLTLK